MYQLVILREMSISNNFFCLIHAIMFSKRAALVTQVKEFYPKSQELQGSGCSTVVEHMPQEQKLKRSWVLIPLDVGLFFFFFFPFWPFVSLTFSPHNKLVEFPKSGLSRSCIFTNYKVNKKLYSQLCCLKHIKLKVPSEWIFYKFTIQLRVGLPCFYKL